MAVLVVIVVVLLLIIVCLKCCNRKNKPKEKSTEKVTKETKRLCCWHALVKGKIDVTPDERAMFKHQNTCKYYCVFTCFVWICIWIFEIQAYICIYIFRKRLKICQCVSENHCRRMNVFRYS